MSPIQTIELRLLGGFALVRGGRPIRLPRSAQRVVALLALRGAGPRSWVAGMLWPDEPERKALANVRTAIWRAQRAGLVLAVSGRPFLRLPPEIRVDIHDLPRSITAGGTRMTELLPGWPDDWIEIQREVLRQMMMYALEHAAGEAIFRGDSRRGLDLALTAVRVAPLRESAHRLVVRAHLAAGNVNAAHRHFDRARTLLRRELGLAPTPRFWQLLATDDIRLAS
jgi:DNA-binding SARP family transcriptional activator